MKRKIIAVMSIFLMFLIVHEYFVHGSNSEEIYGIDEEIVYDLISRRAEIMNRGLYSEKDIDCIIMDLEDIEGGALLKDDSKFLQEARANPTDYPLVTELEVVKMKLLSTNINTYKLKVQINWNMLNATHTSKENVEYFLEVQHHKGRLFLMHLSPVE
ncbi:hypothetical protein [Proteiniborus sp.]|uniref:hypothetical protein n=1 Tax=Proteiniborus sp. TaxID=2079015 RepID=UPI00331A4A11